MIAILLFWRDAIVAPPSQAAAIKGKTVLAITGNYYAAYSVQKITPGQRARSTLLQWDKFYGR